MDAAVQPSNSELVTVARPTFLQLNYDLLGLTLSQENFL